jgi:conjugal transfer mating pair stabilization protein TraN
VTEALQCEPDEQLLALRRGERLCVHVGTYCSTRVLGACVARKQAYCCFNSRLARLVNEQGRAQLGRGYGDPRSPDCSGLTVAEFQRLDLGRLDLSEFYAEIAARAADVPGLTDRIARRVRNQAGATYFPPEASQ